MPITVFATVEDLISRWRALDSEERQRAQVRLEDASAMILSLCAKAGVSIDETDEIQAHNLKLVTCSCVQRAMAIEGDNYGITQATQGAGSYTASTTFFNPSGDLYLTSSEKRLLGLERMQIYSLRPKIGGDDEEPI